MVAVAILQPLDVSKTIVQADYARVARNPACAARPSNFAAAIGEQLHTEARAATCRRAQWVQRATRGLPPQPQADARPY